MVYRDVMVSLESKRGFNAQRHNSSTLSIRSRMGDGTNGIKDPCDLVVADDPDLISLGAHAMQEGEGVGRLV